MGQVIDTLKDWEIIFQDYYNKKESDYGEKRVRRTRMNYKNCVMT